MKAYNHPNHIWKRLLINLTYGAVALIVSSMLMPSI